MTDLLLLAERVEGAEASEQRKLILLALEALAAAKLIDYGTQARCLKFCEAEAYESAALMLVPEGWTTALYQQDKGWAATLKKGFCTSYTDVVFNERGPNGHPATPALALAAAALRARSTMEGLS